MSIPLQELRLWKSTFARGKGLFAGCEKQNKKSYVLTIASFTLVYFDGFSGMHVRPCLFSQSGTAEHGVWEWRFSPIQCCLAILIFMVR